MKVKELRELVGKLKSEGKLTNQTVEFVTDAKKFFASDVKAGTNTMVFEITRDNYHPLTLQKFEESLSLAAGELDVKVMKGNNELGVSESFVTDSTLELVLG